MIRKLRKVVKIVPPPAPERERSNYSLWQVFYEDGKGGTYHADVIQAEMEARKAEDELVSLNLPFLVEQLIANALDKARDAGYQSGQESMMED